MNNFQHAIDATATAENSAGSAAKENEAAMQSLEKQTNLVKAEFQDLANNIIDKELISSILNLVKNAIALLNTGVGRTVTRFTLLTGVLTGGITIFGTIASKIAAGAKQITQFGSAISALSAALSGAEVSAGALGASALPIAAAISAATIAAYGLYKAFQYLSDKWIFDKTPVEEYQKQLEDVETQLKENKKRLDEINNTPWNQRTSDILAERDALVQENEELDAQIDKLNQLSERQARKFIEHGQVVQQGTGYKVTSLGRDNAAKFDLDLQETTFNTLEELVGALQNRLTGLNGTTDECLAKFAELGGTFEVVQKDTILAGDALNDYYISNANDLIRTLTNLSYLNQDQQNQYANTIDLLQQLIDNNKVLGNDTTELEEALQGLNSAYAEASDRAESWNISQDRVSDKIHLTGVQIGELTKAFPNLQNAIESVNGVQYLSVDAMSDVSSATVEEKQAMYDLIASISVFNNSNLDVTDKIARLNELATAAGVTANTIANINALNPEKMDTIVSGLVSEGLSYEEAQSQYVQSVWNRYRQNVNPSTKKTPASVPSGGGGSSKTEKSPVEQENDAWKEQLSLLQDRLELLQKSGGSQEQQLQMMKQIQSAVHAQAEKYRAMGLDDDSTYIRELQKLWWQYQNNIQDIYDDIAKAAEEAAEKARDAWKEALQQQQSDYETAASTVLDQIDEEIKALETERDKEEEYWDAKIQAVKDANEELEQQIEYEQLLNNLAQAKNKQLYVFQNGQFQYVQDVEAISAAQAELDAYDRDRQLEQEVARLEKLKDEALKNIDDQIEHWEDLKIEWEDVTNQYTKEQNKLIAQQVLGIDLEKKNWDQRLMNAQEFANKYNAIMATLATASQEGAITTIGGTSNMSPSDLSAIAQAKREYESATTKAEKDAAHAKAEAIRDKYGYSGGGDGSQYITTTSAKSSSSSGSSKSSSSSKLSSSTVKSAVTKLVSGLVGSAVKKLTGHADGTLSADSGLSLVGERGPELRVLGQGDGIIPADITRNLWDWGKINPSDLSSQSTNNVFNIDNLSLPNVTDAESLVHGLKQMAYQRAYKRA